MADTLKVKDMEEKVLTAILDFFNKGMPAPTLKELARKVFMAESHVQKLLRSLEAQNLIELDKKPGGRVNSRGIRLPRTAFRPVPLVGSVAAGVPIPAYGSGVLEYVPLPAQRVRDDVVFMYEVRGDSMIEDGVLEGDYVIVVEDREPNNGAMAVVFVDEEAAVKRIWWEKDQIRLRSANKGYDDIVIKYSEEPVVIGRVIGLLRWNIKVGMPF
jgi:repressor LexA